MPSTQLIASRLIANLYQIIKPGVVQPFLRRTLNACLVKVLTRRSYRRIMRRRAVPRIAGQLDGDLRGGATYWSIKHRET
jgi:hypothetical protein